MAKAVHQVGFVVVGLGHIAQTAVLPDVRLMLAYRLHFEPANLSAIGSRTVRLR